MNNLKYWYTLLILTFVYQISFIYFLLTNRFVHFNLMLARTYWISAGILGIIGTYILLQVKIDFVGKLVSVVVMILGCVLLGLWFLMFVITNM